MKTLFILDAVNFLFRSYYAIGGMTNSDGASTGALYGFIRSVQKLQKTHQATHMVAVFDGPENKRSRQSLYAAYKAHRKGAPEDLFPQFLWAEEFCKAAGIPSLCVEGVEADDTMASAAVWAKAQGARVYLCTSDKDMMQLIDDSITLLHPAKDYAEIDAAGVESLFGVRPDQMRDLLALMGDSSDNIPGIEGFGPKTASSLLQEFGTLEALLAHPERVKGEKKQEALRTQKDQALLSQKLATLDCAVPIPQEDSFYALHEGDRKALAALYQRMHFTSLLRELGEEPKAAATAPQEETVRYHLVDTPEKLKALFERLSREKELCVDVETTSLEPLDAELVGIGLGIHPKEAWYIPVSSSLLPGIRSFFQKTDASFFGHNLKYDLRVLQEADCPLRSLSFDTLLASYLLAPQNRRHNLDDLALEKFHKTKIPLVSLIGKGKGEKTLREVPIPEVLAYCCEDVDYTCRLKELFAKELTPSLRKLLQEIDLPLLPILAKMERRGVYLDADALALQGKALNRQIEALKAEIFSSTGEEFNLNSPKQLSHVLFTTLGLKKPSHARSAFATSADVLEDLAAESPIVEKILSYRTLEKLRSTYIEALPLAIHPKTGRIHCTFSQSVAATGRLSSQDPNLQNIPIRSPEGKAIRSAFRPEKKGWSYLSADYSQIELRLLAHFADDPVLKKAFAEGEDIHASTAAHLFEVPLRSVTSEMRAQAKTVNFGILYGQGPFGLSKQLRISHQEASSFIKTYFERYPNVQAFLETCKEKVRKNGYSETMTGRTRPIPEIHNKNPALRAAAERLAVNTPLQGTAADLIKIAMIRLSKALEKGAFQGEMVLQIHDELILEAPDEEIAALTPLVQEMMQTALSLSVPLEVNVAIGKNWAEC